MARRQIALVLKDEDMYIFWDLIKESYVITCSSEREAIHTG